MKLEDQVCSFDQSTKFEKLGVKKNSLYLHARLKDKQSTIILSDEKCYYKTSNGVKIVSHLNAYTVSELIDMLPDKIIREHYANYYLDIDKNDVCYTAAYITKQLHLNEILHTSTSKLLSLALADTLICLLENKHINVNDLNKG